MSADLAERSIPGVTPNEYARLSRPQASSAVFLNIGQETDEKRGRLEVGSDGRGETRRFRLTSTPG
jgi:hypothetical protein